MATVSVRNIESTSVTVRVSGVKKGDDLFFFVRLQDDSSDVSGTDYATATGTTMSTDIGGLEPDTDYIANVRVNNVWQTGAKFRTKTELNPYFYTGNIGTNSVTVYVEDLAYGQSIRVLIRPYNDSSTTVVNQDYSASGSSFSKTYKNLSPNTRYAINVRVDGSWLDADEFTTDKPAISKWSWSSSNGTASAAQTKAAYDALINKGPLSDFSYRVWNDMCGKVIEIENALGQTWSTKYAQYADTKMTTSDKRLTATRFNSLRHNIGRSYSTGINEVASGDTVYAWYFTTLARCMNEWIDQI